MQASPIATAGKLHVLDLADLKAALGGKWGRMADHVERFFETAIRRSLAPGDSFSRLNELSYLVMFRELSEQEAQLKCRSISEEVCQRLFGEQGMQATLRNLVGHVSVASLPPGMEINDALDAQLERSGIETIVSRRADEPSCHTEAVSEPVLSVLLSREDDSPRRVSPAEIDYLYRPVWDAANKVVLTYLCQPVLRAHAPHDFTPSQFWTGGNEDDQTALDILLLRECADRTSRLRSDGLRILAAVPVSFSTITRSRLWAAYAQEHRGLAKGSSRDLALIVLGIDRGVPNIRLAQELPKPSTLARNVFCLLDDSTDAGPRFAGTGARAVGIELAPNDPEERSIERIRKLGRDTRNAGLDGFALALQSTSLALHAIAAGIRYLEGPIVRRASADPRHAFAQSLEYLYQAGLAWHASGSVA